MWMEINIKGEDDKWLINLGNVCYVSQRHDENMSYVNFAVLHMTDGNIIDTEMDYRELRDIFAEMDI